ncbi:MAG: HAD family hydrolase [Clostridia bacterium]|nr:HAD family hydrolase [Clostridia bacterium]
MSIKLIASDLDGTIIDSYNRIATKNQDAIKQIQSKNIGFAISTGKIYSSVKNICENFNASYGIFGNGIQVIDFKTGKEIYCSSLDKDIILTCIKIAKTHNFHIHFYTNTSIISEKLMYMDLRNYILNQKSGQNLKVQIVDDIYEFTQKSNEKILRFIISGENELTNIKDEISEKLDVNITLINKCGKYKDTIINKEYEYLDITSSNTSKGQALNLLREYLQLSQEEVMAVGDNINDIDMLQNVGIGVAVANASDKLKQIASYVTASTVEDGGFAEAIEKYLGKEYVYN